MEACRDRPGPLLRYGSVVLALALSAASLPARADDDGDKARAAALLDEGNKLFGAKRYEAARARYEAAYAAYASPKILLNLAEAYRELGDLVRAVESYQRFVDDADARTNAQHLTLARSRLGEIEPQLGSIAVEGDAGTEVTLDGRPAGTLPLSAIRVMAGRHTVIARGFREDVMIRAGRVETVRILSPAVVSPPITRAGDPTVDAPPTLTPAIDSGPSPLVATATPRSDDDTPVVQTWWFWAGVGAVVASAVIVGVAASSGGDDFVPGGELGRVSTADWTTFTPGAGP